MGLLPESIRHPLCAIERLRGRLRGASPPGAEALERHAVAQAQGRDHYLDPVSGRAVWTEHHLRQLEACCGQGCRHCPWPEGS